MLIKPTDIFVNRAATVPVEKTALGGGRSVREKSYSEETITPEGSLAVSAVLAAITILAQDISSLPLILYARRGRDKYRAYDHPYYRLMHDAPNPEHSSQVFRELMMGHLLGWGNFYGQLIFDRKGVVQEIWPLRPDRMLVTRKDGKKLYQYRTSDGKPIVFMKDEILHIPGFGFDGLVGYSLIALAKNAIGLSMAAEKFGSKFFSNGARAGVGLKHPKTLSDPAYKRLQDTWNEQHQGTDNAHKVAILEEGMDIVTMGVPPEEAQFLETRKFQVAEIARIFRVPPHMIGDVERSTSWGSGIDSQEQGYVNHTLRPWTVKTEQGLDQQLLLESDRATGMYFEHLYDALLRGDIQTRYEAYVKAINNGFMTPNEVRLRENMNTYAGGDEFRQPLNEETVGRTGGSRADEQPRRRPVLIANGSSPAREPISGRLQNSFERILGDVTARYLRREANDIRGQARKFMAKQDLEGFEGWLDGFYQEHQGFIEKALEPVVLGMGELINGEGEVKDAELRRFITSFAQVSIEESRSLLRGVSVDTVESLVADWPEQRAAELAAIGAGDFIDLVSGFEAGTRDSEPEITRETDQSTASFEIHVKPTPIQNVIQPTPVAVTVMPAPVAVNNQPIPAPQVTVQNTVTVPEKKRGRMTIKRNADGLLSGLELLEDPGKE